MHTRTVKIAIISTMLAGIACFGAAPGKGKYFVFVVGDQEYRSEKSMPALARILAERHGFKRTVLLPVNRQTGEVNFITQDDIPGLEALRTADLMALFARFLELPDEQMREIAGYTSSGRPIVALGTPTHAFNYQKRKDSPCAKCSYRGKEFEGGCGRQVLGETWIDHYGAHQKESTRGIVAPGMGKHPIPRGVKDIWGESDVCSITTLSGDSKPLLMGQARPGMQPSSPPNLDKRPAPAAWVRSYTGESGRTARMVTITMGRPADFKNRGLRRSVVDACRWALGTEKRIAANSNVEFAGPYKSTPIGGRKRQTGQ
jgi:hypothetical protein